MADPAPTAAVVPPANLSVGTGPEAAGPNNQPIEADPAVRCPSFFCQPQRLNRTPSSPIPTLLLVTRCKFYSRTFMTWKCGPMEDLICKRSRYTASLTSSIERYTVENGRR